MDYAYVVKENDKYRKALGWDVTILCLDMAGNPSGQYSRTSPCSDDAQRDMNILEVCPC